MKCESLILKINKTRRDRSARPRCRPDGKWVDSEYASQGLEVCGGDVKVEIRAAYDYCGYGDAFPELDLTMTCSRCDCPWVSSYEKLYPVTYSSAFDLTPFVEAYQEVMDEKELLTNSPT